MACRMNDPVIFMEHKGLYRQRYAASPEPDENYLLPFGKAAIAREGADATIVTWGATVRKSLEAAAKIEEQLGRSVEVIDLRTLNPLDMGTVTGSLAKTNRVLVVHEDSMTGGFGAELAARIADRRGSRGQYRGDVLSLSDFDNQHAAAATCGLGGQSGHNRRLSRPSLATHDHDPSIEQGPWCFRSH